ncbi:hypothetical protein TNCV_2280221 [Trichonephila clavipes]|nr:hypothetical protein TNCV_2280221 [Trichonephila clavipes]
MTKQNDPDNKRSDKRRSTVQVITVEKTPTAAYETMPDFGNLRKCSQGYHMGHFVTLGYKFVENDVAKESS